MSESGRTALVFGGGGFIGRATCAALREAGLRPVAADVGAPPDGFEFRHVDVTDAAAVSAAVGETAPDVVVHLAALLGTETDAHPSRGFAVNAAGTQHVLDACVEHKVPRLVYASSIAVYGDQLAWGDRTVTEDDLGLPTILYGWHKQLNEGTARHYSRLYGLRTVGLRISTVFGEGRKRGMSAPINQLIEGAASGRAECPFGASTDSCLIHVDDVAAQLAILATAEDPQEQIYNAGGEYSTIGDLAELIAEVRPDAEVTLGPDDTRIPHVSRVDGSRFVREFGFEPRSFLGWAREALVAGTPEGSLPA